MRRRAPEWRERFDDGVEALGVDVLYGLGFLPYLAASGIPVDLLPSDLQNQIGMEVYEAAWDTGREGLTRYCRSLVPALDAIGRMP